MADRRFELGALLRAEVVQRQQEGCNVAAVEKELKVLGDHPLRTDLGALFDGLQALKPRKAFPYEEPSDLESIRIARLDGPR
ncbi:unnamed protein product, partial [marine sediment metagenome]